MVWIWIILGFVILVVIIFLSRIYITGNYFYRQNKQRLFITISIFHIRIYKKDVDVMAKSNNDVSLFNDLSLDTFTTKLKDLFQIVKQSGSMANLILNRISIHQLKWVTRGGTGEASTTGLTSGLIWTIKGALIGIMVEKSNLKCKPEIEVIPYFQNKYIESKMDCIVSIRLGQAIYAFLKGMRLFSIKEIQKVTE